MISFSPTQPGREGGFTIMEVMVSMAIFTVVVTIGIGAVLDAMRQHYTTQNQRIVMDSLNFVMEDMARNIRLGTNMRCGDVSSPVAGVETPLSCPSVSMASSNNILSFNDLNGDIVTYTITAPSPSTPSRIYKKKGAAAPELITPTEIAMDFSRSGFTVRGAEPGDGAQPTVVIRLAGTIAYKDANSSFSIETSVVLRALDS